MKAFLTRMVANMSNLKMSLLQRLRPKSMLPSRSDLEAAARIAVRRYLVALASDSPQTASFDYEQAIKRSDYAYSFIQHPYWEIVSRMLTGTIQSETEQMLSGDDHLSVNRASVAICRKILQMPFFDIEQGKAAESAYRLHLARQAKRSNKAPDSAERMQ